MENMKNNVDEKPATVLEESTWKCKLKFFEKFAFMEKVGF